MQILVKEFSAHSPQKLDLKHLSCHSCIRPMSRAVVKKSFSLPSSGKSPLGKWPLTNETLGRGPLYKVDKSWKCSDRRDRDSQEPPLFVCTLKVFSKTLSGTLMLER